MAATTTVYILGKSDTSRNVVITGEGGGERTVHYRG